MPASAARGLAHAQNPAQLASRYRRAARPAASAREYDYGGQARFPTRTAPGDAGKLLRRQQPSQLAQPARTQHRCLHLNFLKNVLRSVFILYIFCAHQSLIALTPCWLQDLDIRLSRVQLINKPVITCSSGTNLGVVVQARLAMLAVARLHTYQTRSRRPPCTPQMWVDARAWEVVALDLRPNLLFGELDTILLASLKQAPPALTVIAPCAAPGSGSAPANPGGGCRTGGGRDRRRAAVEQLRLCEPRRSRHIHGGGRVPRQGVCAPKPACMACKPTAGGGCFNEPAPSVALRLPILGTRL